MKVSKLTSCAVGCALAVGLSAVAAQPERQYIGEVGVVNSSPDVDDVKAARQVASEFPLSVEMSGPQGGYQVADELTAEGTYTISPALFVYRKGKFRRFDP